MNADNIDDLELCRKNSFSNGITDALPGAESVWH